MPATATITLTSASFADGQPIPARHTGQGKDLSPALNWSDVPGSARELALVMDDPDAPGGDWVHWVLYGIPAGARGLKEHLPRTPTLTDPPGAMQGRNGWPSDNIGYRGPMPPPGKVHHYQFKLYALDREPGLKPGATKQQLLAAMSGHILAEGKLVGTYKR